MRFILNLLWAILGGGFITAIEYLLAGLLCCLTIVGIPFGVQCFKIAGLALFPFGKDFGGPRTTVTGVFFNIVWIVIAGVWIFLSHLAMAIPLAISIIGIPFAFQHVKLAMFALAPFGTTVREVT
jgi:uncharacterized membrane protein YccF (DUF307 family)